MPYGIRLLECLLNAGSRVYLLYSQVAQIVAKQEMELSLPGRARDVEEFFRQRFNVPDSQLRVCDIVRVNRVSEKIAAFIQTLDETLN